MKASGKFVLRIDPELHAAFREEANRSHVSLNQLVVSKLLQSQAKTPDFLQPLFEGYGSSVIGVLLFGSSVRGEQKASSDIDLLIVFDDDKEISRRCYTLWDEKISDHIGDKYSPQFVHLPKDSVSSLWLEVALEGEILFDRTGLVRKTVFEIKARIANGEFSRRMSHGHPYWVRNHETTKGSNAK